VPRLKIRGAVTPLSQHVFIAWCLIKQGILLPGVVLNEAHGQLYIYIFL